MKLFQTLIEKAAKGLLVVEEIDDLTAQMRMAICTGCERFNSERTTCDECGCFLNIKTKSRTNRRLSDGKIEITHCPLGKWFDHEVVEFYKKQTDA